MAKTTERILNIINDTPVPQERMMEFVTEASLLEPGTRGFEGHAFTAVRVFDADFELVSSVMFRLEALANLIVEGELPGWARPQNDDGFHLVHGAIFAATAVQPLAVKNGKFVFNRDALLRRAFRIAQEDS